MTKFFECECTSAYHTMKFVYDETENELYTEIYIYQYKRFHQRVWAAVKYVFGFKNKCGDFDCFIFKNSDIPEFRDLLNKIIYTGKKCKEE